MTAFKNLKIWDGLGDDFSPEISTITFDQNSITDLGGADTDAFELVGLYLIPGLIDAHVHLKLITRLIHRTDHRSRRVESALARCCIHSVVRLWLKIMVAMFVSIVTITTDKF